MRYEKQLKEREAVELIRNNPKALEEIHPQTAALRAAAGLDPGDAPEKAAMFTHSREITEKEALARVKDDPHELAHIKEQIPSVCEAAITGDMRARMWLDINLDDWTVPEPENLEPVEDRKKFLEQVKENPALLAHVQQDWNLCNDAVKENWQCIEFVRHQTENMCIDAARQNPEALKYIDNQTEFVCRTAIAKDGEALAWVRKQTPDIQMAAVTKNGHAITFIPEGERTPELLQAAQESRDRAVDDGATERQRKLAEMDERARTDKAYRDDEIRRVTENPYGLGYGAQTPEIIEAAIRSNPGALEMVRRQTPDICLLAVKVYAENGKGDDPAPRIKLPPEEFTEELARALLKADYQNINYVPQEAITPELLADITEANPDARLTFECEATEKAEEILKERAKPRPAPGM